MLELPTPCEDPTDYAPVPGRADARALRVAILSYRSDPKVGGQGVYVDYLSRALAHSGAAVDVISGPPYPDLSAKVRLIKLPSLDLYAQPHNGHYALRPRHLLSATDTYEYFGHLSGKFVEPATFGRRAHAFLKAHAGDYDVVMDNQSLSDAVLKAASAFDLPLTTMIHHPITRDLKLALEAASDWKQRWLVRRWYSFHRMQVKVARRLPIVTCPSHHAKADIVSEFGLDEERIIPIALGVDQDTFKPSVTTQRQPCRIVTTASADVPLKGLHILLEAYHELLRTMPQAELVVIGTLRSGPARDAMQERGLDGKVQFKSNLSRAALAEEFRQATIAVTPSLYEGFGLPAAEAMSCGTPVIVTDGGALPEVAGTAGVIVPKGDPRALCAAMVQLLRSPHHQSSVGEACLERAKTTFNWDTIGPRYLEFFERAIEAHARRTC